MKLTFVRPYEGMVENLKEKSSDLAFMDESFPKGTVLEVEPVDVTEGLWTFMSGDRVLCNVPAEVFQLSEIDFDKDAMLALCETDHVLNLVFRRLNCPGSPEAADLRVIFNSHVVGNSVAERTYAAFLARARRARETTRSFRA